MELIGEEWPFKCFIEMVEDISLKLFVRINFFQLIIASIIIKKLSRLMLNEIFFLIKKSKYVKIYFLSICLFFFCSQR